MARGVPVKVVWSVDVSLLVSRPNSNNMFLPMEPMARLDLRCCHQLGGWLDLGDECLKLSSCTTSTELAATQP